MGVIQRENHKVDLHVIYATQRVHHFPSMSDETNSLFAIAKGDRNKSHAVLTTYGFVYHSVANV